MSKWQSEAKIASSSTMPWCMRTMGLKVQSLLSLILTLKWRWSLNCNQCRREWRRAGTNYRGLTLWNRAGIQILLQNYAFAFISSIITCQLYKFTLSDQTQITLQLRVNHSELCKDFGPPLLVVDGGENIFSPGPEPALGGNDSNYCPGWRDFKFTVTLNALITVRCTETSSMWRIAVPYSAPRPTLEGQRTTNERLVFWRCLVRNWMVCRLSWLRFFLFSSVRSSQMTGYLD